MSTHFALLTIKLIFSLAILSPVSVFGQQACEVTVQAAQFLHQKNPTLHTSKAVELMNTKGLQKPADKILNWLKYLESATKKHQTTPTALRLIKEHYFKAHLTKPEDVPDSFYQLQVQIAREQGHGTIQLTESTKAQLRETSLKDQKDSLENWLDYFLSPDSDSYPMWAKFWSFNGMIRLGKFNTEDGTFSNRSKGQMSAFPELNREAFAIVIDAIVKKVNGQSLESIQDPKLLSLLDGANFGKIYGHALKQVTAKVVAPKSENGKWVVYSQGSDPTPLVESLSGWNTGWCTAGFETASSQLKGGDFHVFYSQNSDGNFNVPRIAIRMEGEDIGEIRGTAANQNLDPQMAATNVLSKKMSEFGNKGKSYLKKSADMKLLTEIENKHQRKIDLSKSDLRFLYEFDNQIVGFGYRRDPRVDEILSQRDKRSDYAVIYDVKASQVSFSAEQALSGDIHYHFGDLYLENVTSAKGLKLPKHIIAGDLVLHHLTSAEGLILPNNFNGDLDLMRLEYATGLILPDNFSGGLYVSRLKSAKGLILPKNFNGDLDLLRLESADGLILPDNYNAKLSLPSIKSAKGLILPKNFNSELNLELLTSAEDLILPDNFNAKLSLPSLKSAKGLILPKNFNAALILSKLKSAKNLNLPPGFSSRLDLRSIKSVEGLELPADFNAEINLSGLLTAKGLKLKDNFSGTLFLLGLESTDELVLPNNFAGKIYLNVRNEKTKKYQLPINSDGRIELVDDFLNVLGPPK